MYNFLLQIITFSALAAVVYILARALPRVSEENELAGEKPNSFDRLLKKLPLEEIDKIINAFWGKFLRRFKVVILKIDNLVNKLLNRTKKAEHESLPQAMAQPEKEKTEENKNAQ